MVHAGSVAESSLVSIGIAASLGPEVAAQLAPAVEAAGFHALWVNDTPAADALAVLEAAARATTRLTLATGVLPVDRHSPSQIAEQVEQRGLPQERLVLGIGSGTTTTGALRRVSEATAELSAMLEARIVVGALGPKMRRIAVTEANGVLLTWLTPEVARAQTAEARVAASDSHVALYVRTALDPEAQRRLHVEKHRYASIPTYAANFARQRAHVDETVLDAATQPVAERLADYREAVDEVVLRAITHTDSIEDCLAFVSEAKSLL